LKSFHKYCLLNKEKKISIEELKDTFIQLQLELNKEKKPASKLAGFFMDIILFTDICNSKNRKKFSRFIIEEPKINLKC
jgi:hypothetical protein